MLNKIKNIHFNKPLKIVAGLTVFYLLFSYFAVDPLAKRIVPWAAKNHLASNASIGKMAFDPWRLKTTIEDFRLTETSGAPLAGFDKLVVDMEASGLFSRAWKFKEISIIAPHANIAVSSTGKLNWAALIAKLNEDKTPPDDTIPRLMIGHLAVKQGNIQYEDANRPEPFKAGLTPLDFELDSLSTLPQDRGDYLIAAKLPEQGGSLEWKGNIGVNPVASKGEVAFKNIQLAKLMKIVNNATLALAPASGDIQASFAYDFSLPADQPRLLLSNILLAVDNAAGKVTQTGALSLTQAKLAIPELDFSMRDSKPQLSFRDLNLKLTGLALEKDDGHDKVKLLSLPQADVNQLSFDLATRKVKVAQVLLANGQINAVRDKTGNINWQQALASPAAEPAAATPDQAPKAGSETPFTVDVDDIQLQHWQAMYHDQSLMHPLQLKVSDLNLGLMLTMPQGNVEISNLQSRINGASVMSALFNKPIATLEKLDIANGEISLANQKAGIQSVVLSGLKTEVIKPANEPLNWQSILKPAAAVSNKAGTAATNQSSKPDWAVSLKKLALDNASMHIEDRSTTAPMQLDIEKAAFEVQDASLDLSRPLPVKAAFRLKQGGQFNAQGKLTPSPLKANVDLKLAQLAIKPFSPYINQQAMLKLSDGSLDLAGKLSAKEGKQLALAFNGGFSINKLALLEETSNASFLQWERVSSKNLAVTLAPNLVSMSELQVIKPKGEIIIHEDGSMNLTRILRNQPAAAPLAATGKARTTSKPAAATAKAANTSAAQAALTSGAATPQAPIQNTAELPAPVVSSSPAPAFPVNIDTVRIENGELDFADLSLTPQFGTDMHSLTGVINGVSTNPTSVAQVELDGKVDEYGAARIRGSIQPFDASNFTDLKLSFKNLEMNRLTPYSGKFAGRHIDSGKLSVDLEYKIKQRQLLGENKFIINKLKLGERVNSAEAANLPLDLAIAILEDSDGVIDLDLPISGSLDDPKFSYGSIVWKAIRNVLSKIITSPFRALGKLFGSGAEKLEAIAFEAGTSALAPPEREKIKTVAEALNKRQGLALGIAPGYDTAVDTRAIQELTLRRKVAEEMGLELEAGQQAGPIDLTNPKTQKAVDALHDTLTKKGLLKKLVSRFEKPKEGHYEQAVEKLTVSIAVTEPDLQALAKARGEAVRKALIDAGVNTDRLHIDSTLKNKAEGQTVDTRLTLDVKSSQGKATVPEVPADGAQPVSH